MSAGKNRILILAPIVSIAIGMTLVASGLAPAVAWTVSITVLTASWWVTEALPIPVTSLLPFFLFPAFGILSAGEAAGGLGENVIILLMGAFMLSKAIERSGLHRRFALMMIRLIAGQDQRFSERRLVLAFMLTAALLSMWISNSATTLMLAPIALAILQESGKSSLSTALLLGIAYAASVGGVGTLVGTPPNVIFAGIYSKFIGEEFSFLQWMKTGVPIVLLAVPLMAAWLCRSLRATRTVDLPSPGQWRADEVRVLLIFGLTVILWITRKEPFGGWSGLLGMDSTSDGMVALFAVVLMFLTPDKKGGALLDWETAGNIPWGMLLLFAGGIVIAKGFTASGLSVLIGDQLGGLARLSLIFMILLVCLSVTFLTEMTSNTATATLLMPVLAAAALGAGIPPEQLMIPAAISASCAFMLPVATAPNAIVYATGLVSIKKMARQGLFLNLIVAVVVSGVCFVTLR